MVKTNLQAEHFLDFRGGRWKAGGDSSSVLCYFKRTIEKSHLVTTLNNGGGDPLFVLPPTSPPPKLPVTAQPGLCGDRPNPPGPPTGVAPPRLRVGKPACPLLKLRGAFQSVPSLSQKKHKREM